MKLGAHQQERVPGGPPATNITGMPERCSPARVRYAASRPCLLRAVPAGTESRRAAPAGTLTVYWPISKLLNLTHTTDQRHSLL